MTSSDPIVSVIVANFNGERFLQDALSSALSQTLRDIEIIVIDDASSDASVEIARRMASQDNRIRVALQQTRSGPGSARNEGLALARGKWVAILDSDDMMHPSRIEDLVSEAEATGADICADDLLVFQDGTPPTGHLSARQRRLAWVTVTEFVDRIYSREPSLGYLKPLIRTAFLREHDIRYSPDLMIGEDYDLVVQLLAKGARFRLQQRLGYFYRKHNQSISHRLSSAHLEHMIAADGRLLTMFAPGDIEVRRAFDARRSSIERAMAYSAIITAIKDRNWLQAGTVVLHHPRAIPLLATPVLARLRRLRAAPSKPTFKAPHDQVCMISPRPITGNTDSKSTRMIALAKALGDSGHKVTLVVPSAPTFGLMMRLRPEMEVFSEIHSRGTWRISKRLRICRLREIGLSIRARLASLLGFEARSANYASAYAGSRCPHREEQLYMAAHAPRSSWLLLADGTAAVHSVPYALAPSAISAVLLDDRLSSHTEPSWQQFPEQIAALKRQTIEDLSLPSSGVSGALRMSNPAQLAQLLSDENVIIAPIDALLLQAAQGPGSSTAGAALDITHACG